MKMMMMNLVIVLILPTISHSASWPLTKKCLKFDYALGHFNTCCGKTEKNKTKAQIAICKKASDQLQVTEVGSKKK